MIVAGLIADPNAEDDSYVDPLTTKISSEELESVLGSDDEEDGDDGDSAFGGCSSSSSSSSASDTTLVTALDYDQLYDMFMQNYGTHENH